jgi:hypothetical protein
VGGWVLWGGECVGLKGRVGSGWVIVAGYPVGVCIGDGFVYRWECGLGGWDGHKWVCGGCWVGWSC